MIAVLPKGVDDEYCMQKTFVSLDLLSMAYKFVSVPVTDGLRALTQLLPKGDVHEEFALAHWTVFQYSSLAGFARTEKRLRPSQPPLLVDPKSIRVFSGVVDAKEVEVTLVVSRGSAVAMWRTNFAAERILKNILSLFVVCQSSIVSVPERCVNQHSVKYICVHGTGCRKSVSRVTDGTQIRVRDVCSAATFEWRHAAADAFRVEAVDEPLSFLNLVYDAHAHCKANDDLAAAAAGHKLVRKILLIGPSGCGKTRLVKHFAETRKCALTVVDAWRVNTLPAGKVEKTLNAYLLEAAAVSREPGNGGCVLLLDEIELLCKKRGGPFFRRGIPFLVGKFLETVDDYPGLMVVGTTNDIDALHPHIRCAGKMEIELHIGPPTELGRSKILQMYGANLKIPASVCHKVANFTPGFFGAELNSLVINVARIRNANAALYKYESNLLKLFKKLALKNPCFALRGGLGVSASRDIELQHLGGLTTVKLYLKSFVEWPLRHPDAFCRLGLPIPKGILLYGPPGCAKTSLARAVANSLNTNFLFVSAAELYSAYVGEAEKNVVALFDKARLSRPCIIFIDEIDTLAGNRNTSSKNVQSKILSTFLTEMDGVGNKLDVTCINNVIRNQNERISVNDCVNNVIMIAATNRPDKLDSALLRPGRFDKLIFVGPPDVDERLDILASILGQWKMPVQANVDLAEIARKTEKFTGADLKLLLKEAGYAALLRDVNALEITRDDLSAALRVVRPSSTNGHCYSSEMF